MSITLSTTTTPTTFLSIDDLQPVAVDLYRDIHKGIRSELFAVTTAAGSLDPTDPCGWTAFAEHVDAVDRLLRSHAHHEDQHVDPALRASVPDLAAAIVADHHALDSAFASIIEVVRRGTSDTGADRRRLAHAAYLGLGAFTSAYLQHQAVEETEVMPQLERAIGVEAVIGIHIAIVSSIPPDEMMQTLTLMLPAMNLDDRAELLGGMRATAPAPAFAAVVSLARSVLAPADFAALVSRLGLD